MELIHLFIFYFLFFLEFCVDFGDFFLEIVLGGGGRFVTVLCLCLCMVVSSFLYFFFYIDGFLNIILIYRIEKYKM